MTQSSTHAAPAGLRELQQALCRHAAGGLAQSLEAFQLAEALHQVNPPAAAIPRIIEHLADLAQYAACPAVLKGHLHGLT